MYLLSKCYSLSWFFVECKMPLGLSTGMIADTQIKASEFLGKQHSVACERCLPPLCRMRTAQPCRPAGPGALGHCSSRAFLYSSTAQQLPLGCFSVKERAPWQELKPVGTPLSPPPPLVYDVPKESLPGKAKSVAPSTGRLTSHRLGKRAQLARMTTCPFLRLLSIHSILAWITHAIPARFTRPLRTHVRVPMNRALCCAHHS